MRKNSITLIGLPGSGKTTFLAALWHLVTEREQTTQLRFLNLNLGDVRHLNAIASRWRSARVQDRTALGGDKIVSMNLVSEAGLQVSVTFPDVAGEAFQRMWEERECDPSVAESVKLGNVLLFVHSDTIRAPQWVVDVVELSRQLGLPMSDSAQLPWHPRLAPTQVQLVGLLQMLHEPPLWNGEKRRLAVMLSAWDKAREEGLAPAAFVAAKLPLLDQYLHAAVDSWDWRAYGVSAQGGDYDLTDSKAEPLPEAERLRDLERPSTRIDLVGGSGGPHDLTEPLAWLMD